MKRIEYWRWQWRSPVTGKLHKSSWHMDEATVRAHPDEYPDAERVPGTMEIREIAETPDEAMRASPTGPSRSKPS